MQGKMLLAAAAVALGVLALVGLNQNSNDQNQVARIVQAPIPLNAGASSAPASVAPRQESGHSSQDEHATAAVPKLAGQMNYALIDGLLYLFNVTGDQDGKAALVCGPNEPPEGADPVVLTGWTVQPYNSKAGSPQGLLAQPDGKEKLTCSLLKTPPSR